MNSNEEKKEEETEKMVVEEEDSDTDRDSDNHSISSVRVPSLLNCSLLFRANRHFFCLK